MCTATADARRVGTICQHPASRVSRRVGTRIPLLKQCGAQCACLCECRVHVPNSSPARRAACRAAGKPAATISSNKMRMYEHMRRDALLTCGCCSKYPHHRHPPHVALPEFRVAHVQLLDGTCQIVVRGDDPHGEHDCHRRRLPLESRQPTQHPRNYRRESVECGQVAGQHIPAKGGAVTAAKERQSARVWFCPIR